MLIDYIRLSRGDFWMTSHVHLRSTGPLLRFQR